MSIIWVKFAGNLVFTLSLLSCGINAASEPKQENENSYSVTLQLEGLADDDTLPHGSLIVQWTKVSGPGPVIFADPSLPGTSATFYEAGEYVLRITASDGEFTVSDDVVITILSPSGKVSNCAQDATTGIPAAGPIMCQ